MDLDFYFSERKGTRRVIAYVLLAIGLLLVISAIFIGVTRAGDSTVSATHPMVATVSLPAINAKLASASDAAASPGRLKKVSALGLLVILLLLILLITVMLVIMRIAWRIGKTRNRAKSTTYVDAWARYRMPPEQ